MEAGLKASGASGAPEAVAVETPEQARIAADAIARGFQDNEIWVWLIPSNRARARVQKRCYRRMVRRIFMPRQAAWMTDSGTGGALWFPPGTKKLSLREQLAQDLPFLPEGLPSITKTTRLNDLVKANWPTQPHWYLAFLAVEPDSQSRGHGSALIAPGLARADRENAGVWLETQTADNIPFYRRFGFKTVKRVEVDPGVPLWMMWRPPANPASAII